LFYQGNRKLKRHSSILARPVLYLEAFDGLKIFKEKPRRPNDHPEEISDQHLEHNQEGNRGQHTGSASSFGERRPFQRSQFIA
jgi:hypothetical protein